MKANALGNPSPIRGDAPIGGTQPWRNNALLVGAMLVALAGKASMAQAPASWSNLRNRCVPTQPELADRPLTVAWRSAPLRHALNNLSGTTSSAVFLDRRIDPATPVTLSATGRPDELLRRLADRHSWGVSHLAGVWYLGPVEPARGLQTLHARAILRAKAAAPGSVWRQRKPLAWPRLSTPTRVLASACSQRGIRLADPTRAPHDLWPQFRMPAAPFSEQLTLLLVGLELDWRPNKQRDGIELRRLSGDATISATHQPTSAAPRRKAQLAAIAPSAAIQKAGGNWLVTGRVEAHEAIHALMVGAAMEPLPARRQVAGDQALSAIRLTLTVKDQPLGPLLEQLTGSLGLDLEAGERVDLRRRVSFAVREATVDELLAELRTETAYHFAVAGGRLAVQASNP